MNQSLRFWFKIHGLGLLLSLTIGAVISAPPVIWRFSKHYQGVDMLKTNTETHYVAEIQEVYDGHPSLGNPVFADLKDAPYLFPPLSPNIVAAFGRLFSLTAIEAVMITRFLFAALLAFVIYLFSLHLTGRRIIGLVAAPFVMLGYSLVDPAYVMELIRQGGWSQEKTFIDYGRPINPQLSSLFFFSYFLFFWRFLQGRGKAHEGALSAVLLGLSFYVYLFTWSFIFSLNGFLLILCACQRDWVKVKKILGVSLAAAALGIPYFFHVLAVSVHPAYAEAAPRFGFVRLREPNISRLVAAAVLGFLFFYRKLTAPLRLFFGAVFLTAFFVANEQVLTGLYLFNHHYHWYYSKPLIIILFVILLFTLLQKYTAPRWTGRAAALLIMVFLYNGATTQRISYAAALPAVIDEQRYAPLFQWLNREGERDKTVLANLAISTLIPALTQANVYYHGTAVYTLVPNKRLLHAYNVITYLRGIPAREAVDYFEAHRPEIAGYAFGYAYSFQKDSCPACFPASVITDLAEDYRGLSDENFIAYLRRYPLDYLVWDRKADPDWQVDRLSLKKTREFGDLAVYEVR